MGVRNFLVEGLSGTGKTSVCDELLRRGLHAVHGDRELAYQGDPVSGRPLPGAVHEHHVWRMEQVEALIADRSRPTTFLCRGSRNSARFLHLLDAVFVLEVDRATLERRLDARPDEEWGAGGPTERARILRWHATGGDVPREGIRIDATVPVEEVVNDVLRRIAALPPRRA